LHSYVTALPNSYVVIRKRGKNWNPSLAMQEQDEWERHASFMNDLVATGFVETGGPLGDGQEILLFVHAESEADIYRRFDEDPWTSMGLLEIASVKRWRILLGKGA